MHLSISTSIYLSLNMWRSLFIVKQSDWILIGNGNNRLRWSWEISSIIQTKIDYCRSQCLLKSLWLQKNARGLFFFHFTLESSIFSFSCDGWEWVHYDMELSYVLFFNRFVMQMTHILFQTSHISPVSSLLKSILRMDSYSSFVSSLYS